MSKKSLKNLSRVVTSAVALFIAVASAHAIPTWAENYGVGSYSIDGTASSDPFYGSGVDIPRAIAPMPDGGFVVAGQVAFPFLTIHSSYGGKSDACLLRFAADGTILWQFELRQLGNDYAYGSYSPAVSYISYVRTDAQGNIFVAGGKGNPFNSGQVPFVAKFSPAGDLIWQNGIPLAGGTVPGTPPQSYQVGVGSDYIQMSLTNDGGVVITSNQSRPAGYTVPIIAKFDSNGAISLYRAYENLDQYAANGPVAQTADGSNYVTVIRYPVTSNNQGPIYGLGLFVLSATDGSIVAQRGWPSLDGGSEQPIALIRTADGGFASLSIKTDFAGLVFRKFNADASATTVERVINPGAGQQRFYVGSFSVPADDGSFSQTSDGGFLIGGHTSKPFSGFGEDAAVMKLNADGTVAFVSVIGGVWSEGNFNGGSSGSVATPLTDGGYGIAISSATYTTQPAGEDFRQKPDWWVVKTDMNRKVRNFTGIMSDLDAGSFSASASSPQPPVTISYLSNPTYTASPLPSTQPTFSLVDLSGRIGVDLPTLAIQASSPRIVSSRNAEAVVGQYFSYHPLTAFFPTPANVTFSAANLPTGFVINATTGVISGVPAQGSETTTPLAITLNATDGTDTASVVLNLTIGDGVPFFTVNGNDKPSYPNPSATPVPNVNDTVLTFVAKEAGSAAGRVLQVQVTTTPGNEGSWQLLANGTDGFMPYDIGSDNYVLGSTDYPTAPAVYFRARLRSPSHPDVFSNAVGPFDLSSNKTRLGTTKLYISGNGMVSNIRFGVTEENVPSGIVVKMQTTKTPASEGSWTDVTGGTLTQDGRKPNEFYLGLDDYPPGGGNFFRAIAMVPNSTYLQSLSGPQGPVKFVYDLSLVTVTVPHSGSNDGTDYDFPLAVSSGSFNVSTDVQSNRSLQKLSLLYDGDTVESFGGASHGTTLYTTNVAGDHLIEAVAIDDLRIAGHARPVHLRVAPVAPGKTYFITQAGNWNDSSIWIDGNGNHGVPGAADFAVLGNVDVSLSQYGTIPPDVTVKAVSLNGGTMSGVGKLTVTGFCTIGGGRIKNDVDIQSGATLLMINDLDVGLGGRVTNNGRLKLHGKGGITGIPTGSRAARAGIPEPDGFFDGVVAFLKNVGQIIFHPPAGGRNGSQKAPSPAPSPTPKPEVRSLVVASVLNSGLITNDGGSIVAQGGGNIVAQGGGNLIGNDGAGLYDKNGNKIVAQGGGNIVAQGGGNIVAQGGGNIVAQGGGNIVAQGGGNIVAQGGGNIVATGGGNIVAQGGGNIISTNGGGFQPATNQVAAEARASDYVQDGGETDLSGITIIGPVTLNSGILSGTGAIIGDLKNSGGFITPGHSAGAFAITGAFVQEAGGTMVMEAAGGEVNQFDQFQVGGAAQLGGKLDLKTINGYVPLANDAFSPFGYALVTGSFSSVTSNATASQNATGIIAVIDPAKPNPPTGRPANISTRMRVLTKDKVLIGGFIVTGPSGSTKKVLIRGMGPSLTNAGVQGVLADPFLNLYEPNGTVISNDDWGQSPRKDEIPSGFAPGPKESLIIADLAPGAYTVIESGAHNETGIGLTEIYEFGTGAPYELANISTRGFVDTGDNVMIGGFIIDGAEPSQILIRASGPSLKLPPNNLTEVLEDPMLELHDANGNVIGNDDWRATQEQDIIASTVAPADNKEPAILATLVPGSYTAIVRGKNDTTGIAVVEAYKIK